jgi:hypothetical protein
MSFDRPVWCESGNDECGRRGCHEVNGCERRVVATKLECEGNRLRPPFKKIFPMDDRWIVAVSTLKPIDERATTNSAAQRQGR